MTANIVLIIIISSSLIVLGIFSGMLAAFVYRHRKQIVLAERVRARRIVERRYADLQRDPDLCYEEEAHMASASHG